MQMLQRMGAESRSLVVSMISLVYFMRGAISYDEMMWRTYAERVLIKEFLDERFEIEKKNAHPVY
jgi:hypothetical protein